MRPTPLMIPPLEQRSPPLLLLRGANRSSAGSGVGTVSRGKPPVGVVLVLQ